MQSLIESLLLLAREDELRSLDEKTNVNAVVAEQLDLLSELAHETGDTVRVVEQGNLIVDAPPRMIAIALTNLLRNALCGGWSISSAGRWIWLVRPATARR